MGTRTLVVAACALACAAGCTQRSVASERGPGWGLAIHGGAGVITRSSLSPEREAEVRAALERALRAGHEVLARGGSSLDATTAAVVVLEDSPYFNAGKGAVFTHEGTNELDAAVMDGPTLRAGAVAAVRRVKNPVLLARRVMENSPHVMMIGEGAEAFAAAQGLELVEPRYFHTDERWSALQKALAAERDGGVGFGFEEERAPAVDGGSTAAPDGVREWKFGTVGAVALDQEGRLAVATSTGGMTNKRFGRVGDTPIIGAGVYANGGCAVAATGHGEFFIRHTVAHDICARAKYQGVSVEDAATTVVKRVLVEAGGQGGVIAMDGRGNVSMPFNTSGMYRGAITADGTLRVAIYAE